MEDDINGQFSRRETQLMCPWVSAAPIGCTSTIKSKQTATNVDRITAQQHPEHDSQVNQQQPTPKKHKFRTPKTTQHQHQHQRPVDTANHFYYFLKLMQTFPDVHPATLHSVMCLCNHNFSAAIETLITAKNYKETYMHRKMMNNHHRHHPYQTQQTKHLQAQTSNGQLYDIVSIVSDNNMPNIQYSVRSDGNDLIMLDAKKISQHNDDLPEIIDNVLESEGKVEHVGRMETQAEVIEESIVEAAADADLINTYETNDLMMNQATNSMPTNQENAEHSNTEYVDP